eukprot:6204443-Pleurochrysis_carterae.AAC.2
MRPCPMQFLVRAITLRYAINHIAHSMHAAKWRFYELTCKRVSKRSALASICHFYPEIPVPVSKNSLTKHHV